MIFAITIPEVLYIIYGYAVPIVILAVLYGFRWKVGMWGNALSLGAVLFSALIAVGWWEDVAELLAGLYKPMLFLADCVAIWLLFLLSLLFLDTATRFMSTVKVKFNDIVENVGNGIVLFLLFLVLIRFTIFANGHLGMVGEHHNIVLRDSPATNAAMSAVRMLSLGNLSGFTRQTQFDANGDLLQLHLQRRQAIMNGIQKEDKVLADEGMFDNMKRER